MEGLGDRREEHDREGDVETAAVGHLINRGDTLGIREVDCLNSPAALLPTNWKHLRPAIVRL